MISATRRIVRALTPRMSARTHIAMGLTFLLLSLTLLASTLGFVPDRENAVRQGRTALAETIAANSSTFITRADLRRLEATLRLAVDRNEDILSAAVRRADGEAVVIVGDHDGQWQAVASEYSNDTQLSVPIWSADGRWGRVELRTVPLRATGWRGVIDSPAARLAAFLSLCSFLMFYFYLGKTLRHLDPSRSVPQHVRSALDSLAEGLLVIDIKEQIVLANSSFAAIMALNPNKLIGRGIDDLDWQRSDDLEHQPDEYPWTRSLSAGQVQKNEMLMLRDGEGTLRTFIVNCSPVLGTGGRYGGVLISLDDVTQLEEKKLELIESKRQADAANQAKSDFLANMSHEIRTPMNAILGFTEVLKRGYGQSEEERGRHINTIQSSGRHLLTLINDILDLSKIESGNIDLESIDVKPFQLLQSVMETLAGDAQQRNIGLQFEVAGPIPETISTDPTRLRQIVTNLLSNALKFTTEGCVTLQVRHRQETQGDLLSIDVIDTGIGIVPDKLETIFEEFTQADNSVTRTFGGTGLGLSISRRFARMMGGDIIARSTPGEGSVFTATVSTGPMENIRLLSASELQTAALAAPQAAVMQQRFAGGRVLIVDDGPEIREFVRLILEDAGLDVAECQNGALGVERAMSEDFDVILMDMQMPVMDGYTATQTLRSQGFQGPIIAMTANAMAGFEARCKEAGCTRYLSKPLEIDILLSVLAEFLVTASSAAIAQESGAPQSDGEAASAITGAATGNAIESALPPITTRLPLKNPRIRATVAAFVDRLAGKITEMHTAAFEQDWETLAALAHWLKGSAGTVGFDAFTAPAKSLEALVQARDGAAIETAIAELDILHSRICIDESPSERPPAPDQAAGSEHRKRASEPR